MKRTIIMLIVCGLGVTAAAQRAPVDWNQPVTYVYDGSGNITKIGSDAQQYDEVGRLIKGTTDGVVRNFTYDAFGNRLDCTQVAGDNCQFGRTVVSATNRLANTSYDGAGNVTAQGDLTFAYDAANMMTRAKSASVAAPHVEYIYTADDERIAVRDLATGSWRWTLRDASGKVLREFTSQNAADGSLGSANWTWTRDYVWRDSLLLASRQRDAHTSSITTYHYHLDHLGTPRQVTDDAKTIVGRHSYHPFGPPVFGGLNEPNPSNLNYTAHERDANTDLDYMHARYYDGGVGRFLSVDPGKDWDMHQPQSWNMYSYVRNNPINKTDPTGRWIESAWDIANVVIGVKSFIGNVRAGNYGAAALDAGGVVLDGAAVIGPGIPGGAGTALKLARNADRLDDAADVVANGARGRASEARVLDAMGMQKNTQKVTTSRGTSIPDAQDATRVVEVKDTQRACDTCQMKIQREAAQASGREHVVVTGTKTKVSKPLETNSTIIRRDDLGPP